VLIVFVLVSAGQRAGSPKGRPILFCVVINIQHLLLVGVFGFFEINTGGQGFATGLEIFNGLHLTGVY
jgi:hypothetical protein